MNLKFKALVVCVYVWTHVLSLMTYIFNKVLHMIIEKCPDATIPDMSNKEHPFDIIAAYAGENKEITKKAILFISRKWDESFCDKGGVDFHEFGKILNATFIWIAYVLKKKDIEDDEISKNIKKIYTMSIDLKRNIVKKYEVTKETPSRLVDSREILFHRCPIP